MKLTLLLADEVRAEATGKQTVLGLFADNVILLKIPRTPIEISEDIPPGIERLSFLVNVSKLPEGQYTFKGQFIDPSGDAMGEELPLDSILIREGMSHTMVIETKPFIIKGGGEYNLAIWVNNEENRLPFEIRVESN